MARGASPTAAGGRSSSSLVVMPQLVITAVFMSVVGFYGLYIFRRFGLLEEASWPRGMRLAAILSVSLAALHTLHHIPRGGARLLGANSSWFWE